MVSDSADRSILYASISKETTVLAWISSGDRDLETLALKCIEKVPHFHLLYSHTMGKKIYSFLMEDSFVYFTIVDEGFGKSQSFWFLERVKDAFTNMLKNRFIDSSGNFKSLCFHEEFGPTFRLLMQLQHGETSQHVLKVDRMADPSRIDQNGDRTVRGSQAGDLDAITGKKAVSTEVPLLGRPNKYEKKTRSLNYGENGEVGVILMENKVDVAVNADVSSERGVSLQWKGCSGGTEGVQQRARRVWKQHARIVLLIDVVVCCILFVVWLSICKGFDCISH
ncbi:phytolongin Phyl2.2-like [Tasmannia lanceolata]|uniref:phytolongin Phyl2.2-like n=1 Tax=Tasmannia lanceolata TaxID=3420 RepID=UPI004064A087